MDTQMLIGSNFEEGTETEEPILNPKTGETILNLPEASPGQIDAAVAAAEKAFVSWSRTTPAQRSGYLLKIADRIEAEADEFAALEALNCGKPINAVLNDEIPAIVDCYRFFAGAVRSHAGRGRRRISARPHLDDPARSDRHRRLDRAVELSADDDGLEAGAGDRRRQHRRLQAVGADAADGAEAGARSWPTSCPRASSTSCSGAATASATR